MGLDRSIGSQYYLFIRGFVTGRWGFSYSTGLPVRTVIGQRLPATLEVDLYAFLLATVAAFVAAVAATYGAGRLSIEASAGSPTLASARRRFGSVFCCSSPSRHGRHLPGPDGRLSPTATPPPQVTGLYTIDALLAGQWSTFWDATKHLVLPAVTLRLHALRGARAPPASKSARGGA